MRFCRRPRKNPPRRRAAVRLGAGRAALWPRATKPRASRPSRCCASRSCWSTASCSRAWPTAKNRPGPRPRRRQQKVAPPVRCPLGCGANKPRPNSRAALAPRLAACLPGLLGQRAHLHLCRGVHCPAARGPVACRKSLQCCRGHCPLPTPGRPTNNPTGARWRPTKHPARPTAKR